MMFRPPGHASPQRRRLDPHSYFGGYRCPYEFIIEELGDYVRYNSRPMPAQPRRSRRNRHGADNVSWGGSRYPMPPRSVQTRFPEVVADIIDITPTQFGHLRSCGGLAGMLGQRALSPMAGQPLREEMPRPCSCARSRCHGAQEPLYEDGFDTVDPLEGYLSSYNPRPLHSTMSRPHYPSSDAIFDPYRMDHASPSRGAPYTPYQPPYVESVTDLEDELCRQRQEADYMEDMGYHSGDESGRRSLW